MVRFIILIYLYQILLELDLHSNMVRFIIYFDFLHLPKYNNIYIPIWLDLLSTLIKITVL